MLIAQYPFSNDWKRGRIESGPLFKYAGETFNTCIAKSQIPAKHLGRKPEPHEWFYTVFVREHIGTAVRRDRAGVRRTNWTWRYHWSRSFRSSGQAYDLFERLCQAQRNEAELDSPYHSSFMSGPEAPWDPHVLTEMAVAQEERNTSSAAAMPADEWDAIDWKTTVLPE